MRQNDASDSRHTMHLFKIITAVPHWIGPTDGWRNPKYRCFILIVAVLSAQTHVYSMKIFFTLTKNVENNRRTNRALTVLDAVVAEIAARQAPGTARFAKNVAVGARASTTPWRAKRPSDLALRRKFALANADVVDVPRALVSVCVTFREVFVTDAHAAGAPRVPCSSLLADITLYFQLISVIAIVKHGFDFICLENTENVQFKISKIRTIHVFAIFYA